MGIGKWIESWPVYRQVTGSDALGRGKAAQSARSAGLTPRTAEADHVAHSVCPYCAVGCAQNVYVKDGQVVQIEGNPDSPISRGRLCPKGCGTKVEFRLPWLPPTEPFQRSNKILAFAEVKGSTFPAPVALRFTVRTMVNGPRRRVPVPLVLASLSGERLIRS